MDNIPNHYSRNIPSSERQINCNQHSDFDEENEEMSRRPRKIPRLSPEAEPTATGSVKIGQLADYFEKSQVSYSGNQLFNSPDASTRKVHDVIRQQFQHNHEFPSSTRKLDPGHFSETELPSSEGEKDETIFKRLQDQISAENVIVPGIDKWDDSFDDLTKFSPEEIRQKATDFLENCMTDSALWTIFQVNLSKYLGNHFISSGKCDTNVDGCKSLIRILNDKDPNKVFEILERTLMQIKKHQMVRSTTASRNIVSETGGHTSTIKPHSEISDHHSSQYSGSNTDDLQHENERRLIESHDNRIISTAPTTTGDAVGVNSSKCECGKSCPQPQLRETKFRSLYERLDKVLGQVFAKMEILNYNEIKVITLCGRVVFDALFDDEEILGSNVKQRKMEVPAKDKDLHMLDEEKCCIIAKFLAWMLSKPTVEDRTIDKFKEFVYNSRDISLSQRTYNHLRANIFVKYRSIQGKKILVERQQKKEDDTVDIGRNE